MLYTEKNKANVTANTSTQLSEIVSDLKRKRQELRQDIEEFYQDFDLPNVLHALNSAKNPLYIRAERTKSSAVRAKTICDLVMLDEVGAFLVSLKEALSELDQLNHERQLAKMASAF